MSKRKQCSEKVRAAGEVASFLDGEFHDYAFITKESRNFFGLNKDAGMFISKFDNIIYEGYLVSNDFHRDPRFRALNN